ncbi:MAG: hypothetical protein WCO98_14100 [bacterium]
MLKDKKVLIISTGKYPEGDAWAVPQHTFAKLFKHCRYECIIIGMGASTGFILKGWQLQHQLY